MQKTVYQNGRTIVYANKSKSATKIYTASICVLFVLCFWHSSVMAQAAFVSAQDEASGTNGKVDFSLGQSFTLRATGDNGTTINGIQQPFSIYTLGVEDEVANISVSVFPNPVTRGLVLKTPAGLKGKTEYALSGINGNILCSGPCLETETRIDMSEFTAATYVLTVFNKGKNIKSFTIIKH